MVAVATFRRNDDLRSLLHSLEAVVEPRFRVVVVDNDPEGGAAAAVEGWDLPLTYRHEPTPGIAAARNRALDEIAPGDRWIAFVDDDERVTPTWLSELVALGESREADVVSGPVISVFAPNTPAWILRGGFIQRPRFPHGSVCLSPATNNTLVRVSALEERGWPRFSEEYSLTGGSDTEFFRRMRDQGAVMLWCDDALVHEDVPADRATLRWILRRGLRVGNVTGRLRLRHFSRARLMVGGVVRVGYGVARVLVSLVRGRGLRARDVDYLTRGLGWIGASSGGVVVEYKRSEGTEATS